MVKTLQGEAAAPAAAPAPKAPERKRWLAIADRRLSPYAYISPFFLLFLVFGMFPLAYTAWVSLHRWHIFGDREFIGLANYTNLVADPKFITSLVNTFSILVLSTVPQLLLALLLATVLHRNLLRGAHLFKVGLLMPFITSTVAVAVIFESIFGFNYGIVNAAIELVGLDRINWQANRFASHVAISTMIMWRWTGYNALIYLAALQAIPKDVHEAAAIDGASRTQQFFLVTIPMLRPVILFTVILSTIGGLQIFAEPMLFNPGISIEGGNANQFLTTTLYLYGQAFRQFKFGYASAIAMMLFLIIVLTSLVNYLLARRIASPS
jgi:cellobiose transport system permease protein